MFRSGFFVPQSDPSPLIFICRYRVPIQYLALTNIFLDNTAALRKKVAAFLNRFLFCWNKVYTFTWLFLFLHMLFQHWLMLHCDSRPSCTAAEVCEMQPTLGASLSSTACFIFLTLSCKMTWTRCLSVSHAFSISSIACLTCFAVWDPPNWCTYQHVVTRKWSQCNVMQRW